MPYIRKELRPELDALIAPIVEQVKAAQLEDQDGSIDYVVTKIITNVYPLNKFFHFNRAIGVLQAILLEFYRRKVSPYEDKKIVENGDVY
ncbi:hypothetical protein HYW66_01925 [Candidatus Microgenomates bacterium]|nr:hypothetical protein [Candidatus Microgenomates bacterium]